MGGNVHKFLKENLPNLLGREFLTPFVGEVIDPLSNLRMHRLGQIVSVLLVDDVCHSTFPRLGVDSDNRLVAPPDVMRIDGQVGNPPTCRPPPSYDGRGLS